MGAVSIWGGKVWIELLNITRHSKQNFRTVFPIPNDSERIRTKKPNGVQLPNGSRTLPNGFRTLPNGFPNDFVSICSLCGEYQQTALRCRPMLCLFSHPESKSASPWPRSPVEQHATPPMSFFWIFFLVLSESRLRVYKKIGRPEFPARVNASSSLPTPMPYTPVHAIARRDTQRDL